VLLGIAGCLVWRTSAITFVNLIVAGNPENQWWRVFTAPFVYDNTGYAFVALTIIGIFGWLIERRHGPVVVLALALVGGAGGAALAGKATMSLVLGGNGAAMALLCAWAVPDLLDLARKREVDGDLIGVGVLAAVMLLMPIAVPGASVVASGVGVGAGLILGYLLARVHHI
jgi:membrane associated rhomboid family serine protease